MSEKQERIRGGNPRVIVVGSLNIDHIWSVPRLPMPGETMLAATVRREVGGKGANQAVAAARHGAQVSLVGVVGVDADGQRYREHLDREHIDASAVLTDAQAATGAAHVYVDAHGENMIVVNGGANQLMDARLVAGVLATRLADADVLLAQLECPLEAVGQALRMAHEKGVRSVLNASPFNAGFAWTTPIDTVIVNEHECEAFFRHGARELQGLPAQGRREFLRTRQFRNLIVTQGGEPALHFSAEEVHAVPAYRVEPRDTVGAGDTFAGVLAVRLAEGAGWEEAIWYANVAAALSTLSSGAQSAMPTRERVEAASKACEQEGGEGR